MDNKRKYFSDFKLGDLVRISTPTNTTYGVVVKVYENSKFYIKTIVSTHPSLLQKWKRRGSGIFLDQRNKNSDMSVVFLGSSKVFKYTEEVKSTRILTSANYKCHRIGERFYGTDYGVYTTIVSTITPEESPCIKRTTTMIYTTYSEDTNKPENEAAAWEYVDEKDLSKRYEELCCMTRNNSKLKYKSMKNTEVHPLEELDEAHCHYEEFLTPDDIEDEFYK
jgi:hypothetical protein